MGESQTTAGALIKNLKLDIFVLQMPVNVGGNDLIINVPIVSK